LQTVMPQEVKSAVVLACGNALRGDDGVAWAIGSEIERSIVKQSLPYVEVEVIFTQQLLPEHGDKLSRTDLAIFIDCSVIVGPGKVSAVPIRPAERLPHIFTHHLDPPSLLGLTQHLYGRVPLRAVSITVGGQSFALSEKLSKPAADAIPMAKAAVCAMLLAQ
jgi:hydrogenase maturation protease